MKPVSTLSAIAGADIQAPYPVAWKRWRVPMGLAFLICLAPHRAMAQTTAEPAQAATPVVSATPSMEEIEAANRKVLDDQAGKNAAKLMLRSVPDKSSVRIDGKPVGKTPLLLILHPGVYVVEIEDSGPRMEYGRRQVDLLPKEAREVVLSLQPRYPGYVSLSWSSHR